MRLTRPPTARPVNITGTFPYETVCINDPMQKMMPDMISAHFLPNLSPIWPAASDPKKQPAWSKDTMFAEKASVLPSKWKSLLVQRLSARINTRKKVERLTF